MKQFVNISGSAPLLPNRWFAPILKDKYCYLHCREIRKPRPDGATQHIDSNRTFKHDPARKGAIAAILLRRGGTVVFDQTVV